jgi:hypothetical protein
MSWLFSRALVEEYSAASSSAGALSALSSGSPTPRAFLPPDRTTDFSRPSRFGMTFGPLTDALGAELLTWFLAASRAKTSAWPARAQASTANAQACGDQWRGSLARFDPASRSWRTAQRSLLADSNECSVTWPRSGMTADGQCWELPTLAPPTSATGSGLWLPTPCTVDTGSMFNRSNSPNAALRPTLGAMAKHSLWPTVTVNGNYNRKGASAKSGGGLATAVANWPTPTASLGTKGGRVTPRKGKEGGTLIEAVSARRWPTPQAGGVTMGGGANARKAAKARGDMVGGALNPTWVETLMGWCIGWTDLKPMSHIKMCFWLMGFVDGAERCTGEVLRVLRNGHAAEEVRAAIGRPVGVSEAAVLLADLCEHQNRPDEARIFMACSEALEADVRSVRIQESTSSAPHRLGQDEQRAEQHPDAMQALSRLLAFSGAQAWQDGSFEDAIPRVADGVDARVDRLKALGNGQVPLCAASAWRLLTANV